MSSRPRICTFTDALLPPYDEGIRKVTRNVYQHLSGRCDVLLLATDGAELARVVAANKALLNPPIMKAIRGYRPDAILYIPEAAMTVNSVIRARILKLYGRGCPVAVLSLQPRTYSDKSAAIVRRLKPDLVITQSSTEMSRVRSLGCKAVTVPAGVDLDEFTPVDKARKAELRRQYGLDRPGRLILHIGHIRESRNVRVFKRLQRTGEINCVLVGSTSTEQDMGLARELSDAGVTVIDKFQPSIQELYQLADLYTFPVSSETAAITFPLSVLEALACNVPVVTTRFGGLADALPETDGLKYVGSSDELVSAVEGFDCGRPYDVRLLVKQFSWDHMADLVVAELEEIAR